MIYETVTGSQAEKPAELDTASSAEYVYYRRIKVDLNDVKFGVGMGANVFNIPEEKQDDTSRIS